MGSTNPMDIEQIIQKASGKTKRKKENDDQKADAAGTKALQDTKQPDLDGSDVAGIVFGNVSNASTIYGMDKFNTPRGHGFAAERANHLQDILSGKDARLVGDNNAINGADRVVNGVSIQSKYCATGAKCIDECFDVNGNFRYLNTNGSPMQIEVPADKYDAAVQSMQEKIKNGKIPGVNDPEKAEGIVKKGHFTYEQAKNIAKCGTVESLKYDAKNGMIVAAYAAGISATLSFATSIWNGKDIDEALRISVKSAISVGGTAFMTSVIASQLSKAGMNGLLVGGSEAIVSCLGPRASAVLVNAFRNGTNIYGAAAMTSAAKMLRGNVITGAVTVVVLSSVDVVDIFRGRISGAQLFKNLATTTASVAGGTAGWVGGAAAGAALGSFIPFVGTAVGGVVGGLLGAFGGGSVAGSVSKSLMDSFIEDDANEMIQIIQSVFETKANDYLLNYKEAERAVETLKDKISGDTLKEMYSSPYKYNYASDLITPIICEEIKNRKYISMPEDQRTLAALKDVLEEFADDTSLVMA